MTTNEVIAICIAVATLIAKLAYDYRKHLAGGKINHTAEGAIVFVCLVASSLIAGHVPETFLQEKWLNVLLWFVMVMFNFWAFMDTIFGILIARNPWFLGDSSALDRTQKRNPALVWFKYAMVPLSIILYVKLHV